MECNEHQFPEPLLQTEKFHAAEPPTQHFLTVPKIFQENCYKWEFLWLGSTIIVQQCTGYPGNVISDDLWTKGPDSPQNLVSVGPIECRKLGER